MSDSDQNELVGEIANLFAQQFELEAPRPDDDLLDSGLVDSVRIVELVLALENRFGVSLPFEEFEIDDFRSVASLAQCVGRALQAAS